MYKVVIASSNENKIKEFQEILKPFDIKVIPYQKLLKKDVEIEESGKTFSDNAKIKAEAICEMTGLPTFADDSGFCIKELDCFPGVFSARFAEEVGGYQNAFEEIRKRLNGKCSDAKFVSVIAFARKNEKTICFEGTCYGFTIFPPRGENGFGYDSIFVPNSFGRTFAEMTSEEKNLISHRAIATSKFLEFLEEWKNSLNKKRSEKSSVSKTTNVKEETVAVEEKILTETIDTQKSDDVFEIEVDEKFVSNIAPVSQLEDEKV